MAFISLFLRPTPKSDGFIRFSDKPIYGKAIIWGIRPVKPIVNIPADALKVRLRLRNDNCARAYVRFEDRIEQWIIQPSDNVLSADTWILGWLEGVNYGGQR